MVFASLTFLWVFLPVTLAFYFAGRGAGYRDWVLLVASLVFYAWGEPGHLPQMLVVILSGYVHGRWIDGFLERGQRGRARIAVISAVGICLGFLGIYKYLDFGLSSLAALTGVPLSKPGLVLPLGISFYTFQTISYVVDVYRGSTRAERSVVRFATYITMFSQLIAGPIVRYVTVAAELTVRTVALADAADGARRFVIGLGKKVLLANSMGVVADAAFRGSASTLSCGLAWYGLAAYALQIYFDFSGYSDMAIGLGRTFGFHFLENFQHPYASRSVSEFWRRWHISLSSFFRDYVYIPMGGSRVGPARLVGNLLCVWALTGLWHGAAWNFVVWGLYFGLFLILEKLLLARVLLRLPAVAGWLYMTLVVLGGWILFRADSIAEVPAWCTALASGNSGTGLRSPHSEEVLWHWPILVVAVGGAFPWIARGMGRLRRHGMGAWLVDGWLLLVLGLSTAALITDTFNPFIYFRF